MNDSWNHPFAGSRSSTTDKYGWRTLNGSQNFHRGLDLDPGEGTQIYSIRQGTVVAHGDVGAWAGTSVVIRHDDGWHSVYAHMIDGSKSVSLGQRVPGGFKIGKVGNTGESYGAHLHLEVWTGPNRTNHTDPWPVVMTAPLADQIPTTPTTEDEEMARLVKHPNGSVALAANDGSFTILSSMDQVNALVATGACPATIINLPDPFIWNLRVQVADKRKAQN